MSEKESSLTIGPLRKVKMVYGNIGIKRIRAVLTGSQRILWRKIPEGAKRAGMSHALSGSECRSALSAQHHAFHQAILVDKLMLDRSENMHYRQCDQYADQNLMHFVRKHILEPIFRRQQTRIPGQ